MRPLSTDVLHFLRPQFSRPVEGVYTLLVFYFPDSEWTRSSSFPGPKDPLLPFFPYDFPYPLRHPFPPFSTWFVCRCRNSEDYLFRSFIVLNPCPPRPSKKISEISSFPLIRFISIRRVHVVVMCRPRRRKWRVNIPIWHIDLWRHATCRCQPRPLPSGRSLPFRPSFWTLKGGTGNPSSSVLTCVLIDLLFYGAKVVSRNTYLSPSQFMIYVKKSKIMELLI